LIFSPTNSLIKKQFYKESPGWIDLAPKVDADWSACLQTLEGHSDWVSSVAISGDGRRLASGSSDNTVKLWDAESGACLQTLEGHSSWVRSVAFSADGRRLASGSDDKTVKLWDDESGDCLQTLNVGRAIHYLSFDPDHHSRILSDVGDIILESSFINSTLSNQGASSTDNNRTGYGISADNLWITYKGDNLIWLPPDYRPLSSRIAGSTIAIGCSSGRVWMVRFAGMELVKHK
jgi:WD40 repeat protein